jgi:hypothetical protein
MDLFDEAGIAKFEEQFVAKIVNEYNLSTSCLIYDATNFFYLYRYKQQQPIG